MIVRNPENIAKLLEDKVDLDDIDNDLKEQIRAELETIGLNEVDSLYRAAKMKVMLINKTENGFSQACVAYLKRLNNTFFYDRTSSLITSSTPVYVGCCTKISDSDKTFVYLALSPNVAVLFGNCKKLNTFKNKMINIDEKLAAIFNRILVRDCNNEKLLISNSDVTIKNALKK